MPTFMKQGFVLKQGGNRKNWKKRWFSLTDRDPGPPYTPALLSYYTNASLNSALGNVNLDECIRAQMIPYFKEHNGHSKLLEIEVPGRVYRLLFKTEADRDDWMTLIQKVSRNLQAVPVAICVEPDSDEKALFPEPANAARLDAKGDVVATTHFCRGWLEKVGNRVKNWKRRWFVLKGYVISYYKDKGGGSPLGIIDLCECTAVYEKTGPNLQHAFAVETKNREFVMMAENGAEVHMWITAIQQAIKSRDALAQDTLMRVRTRSEALRKSVICLDEESDDDGDQENPFIDDKKDIESGESTGAASNSAVDKEKFPVIEEEDDGDKGNSGGDKDVNTMPEDGGPDNDEIDSAVQDEQDNVSSSKQVSPESPVPVDEQSGTTEDPDVVIDDEEVEKGHDIDETPQDEDSAAATKDSEACQAETSGEGEKGKQEQEIGEQDTTGRRKSIVRESAVV